MEYSTLINDRPVSRTFPKSIFIFGGLLGMALMYATMYVFDIKPSSYTTAPAQTTESTEIVPKVPKKKVRPLTTDDLTLAISENKGLCTDPNFSDVTLKMAYEHTYFSLLVETYGQKKFEASDVLVLDNRIYVVCDSSWGIGYFPRTLQPFSGIEIWPSLSKTNLMFDDNNKDVVDQKNLELINTADHIINTNYIIDNIESQWEAIVYDDKKDLFLIVQESIQLIVDEPVAETHTHMTIVDLKDNKNVKGNKNNKKRLLLAPDEVNIDPIQNKSRNLKNDYEVEIFIPNKDDSHYHAHIQEVRISPNGKQYDVIESCSTSFAFKTDNKGLEGAVGLRTVQGELLLLGLCEGNYCDAGIKGEEEGNGRIIVMHKVVPEGLNSNGEKKKCRWKTITVLAIPTVAHFTDYASIAIRGDKIMIGSQQSSSLFLGIIEGLNEKGEVIDVQKLKISETRGHLLSFPRDSNCDVIYCNIEGVAFLNDHLIVAVSDKMKRNNKQSFKCLDKDQSIHVFQLPIGVDEI